MQCEERVSRAKSINGILRRVAEQLGYTEDSQLEDLYEKTAWYFDRKLKKKAAANDVFKKAMTYILRVVVNNLIYLVIRQFSMNVTSRQTPRKSCSRKSGRSLLRKH